MSQQINRRNFLRMGLKGVSLFAAGGLASASISSAARAEEMSSGIFSSLHDIGDLLPPDENGVRLPPGFKSRIVARSGEAPVGFPGYTWHAAPDGGATYATEDGGWVYVSNCERRSNHGGVGALRFSSDGEVIDAYSILQNTSINCAGGSTPWGTWLSCEEFSIGQVYECDPMGNSRAVVRPALGSFRHEAVVVDSENQCLYLTEDTRDGGFYRFRPDGGLPNLSSGVLEIAAVNETAQGSFIEWHTVPDPSASDESTRHQVPGSYPFKGGEGIGIFEGKVYFTTKHDNRVWIYDTDNHKLEVLYDVETSSNPILTGVDNVVITSSGDVLVAEDGGDMQLVVLTDDRVIPLLQIVGHERSEITGPAFDPSYKRLYFSSQRGSEGRSAAGITYEISAIG
jgi:uncharacterized protein